ncbi:hypothetical protein WMY93_022529 [Mugilogobius chulae]|uniref:Uncharacterized protein n=1 Tax=Mugilogobius chulae TaxID=88201 RepID=A0AAW0NBQ8_9GOBI
MTSLTASLFLVNVLCNPGTPPLRCCRPVCLFPRSFTRRFCLLWTPAAPARHGATMWLLWVALFHGLCVSVTPRSHSGWCQLGCDCRGELKFTICSRAMFTALPSRVPPTTELLDLSHNLITVINNHALSHNRKLRVLLLQHNNISLVEDGSFSQLEFLQKLDLSWNRIRTLSEGFSFGLTFLRELQLSHNLLTSLTRLNLTGNFIHQIGRRSFASMSSLRHLHLADNQLIDLKSGIFSMLRSLEVLNLERNYISETDVGVFKPLTV